MATEIVHGSFSTPTDDDYEKLEKFKTNPYNECVKKTIKSKNKKNPICIDKKLQIVLNSVLVLAIEAYKAINQKNSTKDKLSKICLDLKSLFLGKEKLINLDSYNNKSKGVNLSKYKIYADKLKEKLRNIEFIVMLVINGSKQIKFNNNIQIYNGDKVENLVIGSKEELYYLTFLLLLNSKKCYKEKTKQSWVHEKISDILYYEVRIALLSLNDDISLLLRNLFSKYDNEHDDSSDIIRNYINGLFSPIIKNTISSKSVLKMEDYQINFADNIEKIINDYVDCIINLKEWSSNPTGLFNLNTFGTGKTTISSEVTSYSLAQANNKLRIDNEKKIEIMRKTKSYLGLKTDEERLGEINKIKKEEKKLVGVFTLPSISTAVSFASSVAMEQPTWIIQNGRIIPLHEYCPKFEITQGRKVTERTERWADKIGTLKNKFTDGLNFNAPLIDQVMQLMNWTPTYAKSKKKYIKGKDYYKTPIMIFADSVSALELNKNAKIFENELKWFFFNIIDEFPATGDCNFDIKNNYLLKNIIENISIQNKFSILMSASPTEEQINSSLIFKNWNKRFAEVSYTTRSFTQLYIKNKPIYPLNALDSNTFNIVKTWNDTDFRFFNPIIFLDMIDLASSKIDFKLKTLDIQNQNTLIKAIRNFLLIIADSSDDDLKNELCNMSICYAFPKKNISQDSHLTLTSGNLNQEILNSLNEPITHELINNKFDEFTKSLENEIQKIRSEIAEASQNREKSAEGSQNDLRNEISRIENILKNRMGTHIANIITNIGRVQITRSWYEQYASNMSDEELSVMLCGQEIDFHDDKLNEISKKLKPISSSIIDNITSMFGRNNHQIKNVIIKDPNNIIGYETLKQALARAGRSGNDPIVTGIIEKEHLDLFKPYTKTSIHGMDLCYSN